MFAEQPLSLMEQDWDLHAVVRGCCSTRTSSTTTRSAITTTASSSVSSSSGFGTCNYLHLEAASSSSSSSCGGGGGGGFSSLFDSEQGIRSQQILSLPSAYTFEARSPIEELHELCKPFFTKSQPQQQHHHQQQSLQASSSSSPLSSFSYTSVAAAPKPVQTQEKQQQQQQQRNKHPHQGGSVTTQRSKRRKNQLKRVCQVPVENLSSDIWAWRKYGQKPIKGSPYPRGYYRCSSSKGCLARKQVERNRSDPTMFIVTYTAEHNHPAPTHRNSLAGSTRQKPLTPQTAAATTTTTGGEESEKALAKPTSPVTPVVEEETPPQGEKSSESKEEREDVMDDDEVEGDELVLSDMVLPDDFFESLDELGQLTGTGDAVTGDCFTDPFSAMALPSLGGQ